MVRKYKSRGVHLSYIKLENYNLLRFHLERLSSYHTLGFSQLHKVSALNTRKSNTYSTILSRVVVLKKYNYVCLGLFEVKTLLNRGEHLSYIKLDNFNLLRFHLERLSSYRTLGFSQLHKVSASNTRKSNKYSTILSRVVVLKK